MADLYHQYRQPQLQRQDSMPTYPSYTYPIQHQQQPPIPSSLSTDSVDSQKDASFDSSQSVPSRSSHESQKQDTKPQATFLTKLYALLERPENHHMIRWDPAGEHIIVERPEQLALHVLPSIYRQSRFASFSRQLNIYGFMRKVNLRNVDPSIDDPDASTWSHPTLNRHSPPEVVANFKRRVPPRLPKPRKRDLDAAPPRSAVGPAPPLPPPLSSSSSPNGKTVGRARSFTTPGSFSPPLSQPASLPATAQGQWNGSTFIKAPLPPLLVPEPLSQQHTYQHHTIHPLTPTDEPSSQYNGPFSYSVPPQRDPTHQYSYPDQSTWSLPASANAGGHSGSLSSLLNPSSNNAFNQQHARPTPTIDTSYGAPSFFLQAEQSASSISPDSRPNTGYSVPDSRPNTGYSVTSVSSMPYDDQLQDYSRPGSSHLPMSPIRPTSSKSNYGSTLSIRRGRRHSQALNPYPSPYNNYGYEDEQRPSTSPAPFDHTSSGIPRVRSMIQLPSLEPYGFASQPEFAFNPVPTDAAMDPQQQQHPPPPQHPGWAPRPSTSTSTISQTSSQVRTPDQYPPPPGSEAQISRSSPVYDGYLGMSEQLTESFAKLQGGY